MTFRLFAVEINDFKCYAGEHLFEFPQEAGLYYLTGQNQYNPRLGANGCGKSSLIDAIEWCLFGKTTRGLKSNDVITWGKKKCSVEVSLVVGDRELAIGRTQNPNKIFINGEASTQDDIQNAIRLNQEAFNASVVLPQFGDSFFDLSPTQKLAMFSQAMNLDYWMDRSKEAADKAGTVLNQITLIEKDKAKCEGKLSSLRDEIKDLKKAIKKFDRDLLAQIESVDAEIEKLENTNVEGEKKLPKLEKEIKSIDTQIRHMQEAIDEAVHKREMNDNDRVAANAEARGYDRQIKDYEADLADFAKLKGKQCPTCLQTVDADHIEDYNSKQRKVIKRYRRASESLKVKAEKIEKRNKTVRADINEFRTAQDELREERRELRDRAARIKESINTVNTLLKRAKRERDRLEESENPYDDRLVKRKASRKELKEVIAQADSELEQLRAKHEAYNYWVNGFKRVRLYVIEEALTSLELEINNNLSTLGLTDWKITLDVERENKSGGITKGFVVFIQSPKHEEPVRYEAWSGGETQRLRLAGDLGLANLIMEQSGLVSEIEIIDEPSEHMSPEGIQDMIETLYQRTQTTGKQIWLVDHHALEFGNFAGTLTSVMDKNGKSRLEYKESSEQCLVDNSGQMKK